MSYPQIRVFLGHFFGDRAVNIVPTRSQIPDPHSGVRRLLKLFNFSSSLATRWLVRDTVELLHDHLSASIPRLSFCDPLASGTSRHGVTGSARHGT